MLGRVHAERAKGVRPEHRRDAAERGSPDENELRPAEEKGDEPSPALAQIHIEAAGLWIGRGELGERERAAQRQHAPDDPDGQHQRRIGHARGDDRRRPEDARSDGDADDEADAGQQPEAARETLGER